MFKVKITPKTIKTEYKFEVQNSWCEIHSEVGFSPLQPGDVIVLRSDAGTYTVDHKVLLGSGERVFVRLVSNNPNIRGYDFIPRGDRYEMLGASIS